MKQHPFLSCFLVILLVPLSIQGQNGYMDKYSTLKGARIISRISTNGQYKITCYHATHNIANFILTDGNVFYNFPSSSYVTNDPLPPDPVLNHGFIVRDMKIVGDTCWICGSYWEETGEWIYNLQGQLYWEVLYSGFIGYVTLSGMAQGANAMTYITIPEINYLNKMVGYTNGVAAIGECESEKVFYVEVTHNTPWAWTYKLGKSSYPEEEFRDITYAGEKVVVLSRFNDPQHVMFYKHGIGLRYGTPGSFISTCQHLYCYSTRFVDGTSDLDFDPEGPMVLDKTYISGGVAVGYICNPTVQMDTYRGRLVFFIFDAENDNYPECIVSKTNQVYKTIKDISSIGLNKSVVLLEDSLGKSVYRFSQFQYCTYEKMLSFSGPKMMSVSSFISNMSDMGLFSGGHYLNSQKKISSIYEQNILARINSWNANNCTTKTIGGSDSFLSSYQYPIIDSAMNLIRTKTVVIKQTKLYPSAVSPTRECTDVN